MTKWTLQSEKPIQEHFTAPCWVQFLDGDLLYAIPQEMPLTLWGSRVIECVFIDSWNDDFVDGRQAGFCFETVVAWQYVERPTKPEPYVPPALPKMKAEWIDGDLKMPDSDKPVFLIREKGNVSYLPAVWVSWSCHFVQFPTGINGLFKEFRPDQVEWLEITEEQS